MTSITPLRGYPYPECDPPLVKDASDIADLRDLALAVDVDAEAQETKIEEFWERPDAARISFSGSITNTGAATGFVFIFPFDTVVFDNTAGSTSVSANALRPRERGWYMINSHIRCSNGGNQETLVRHIRNSTAAGRHYEGPAFPINTGEENMTCMDILYLDAFDTVRTQVRQSGLGGLFTYSGTLSMVQLLKLDV